MDEEIKRLLEHNARLVEENRALSVQLESAETVAKTYRAESTMLDDTGLSVTDMR